LDDPFTFFFEHRSTNPSMVVGKRVGPPPQTPQISPRGISATCPVFVAVYFPLSIVLTLLLACGKFLKTVLYVFPALRFSSPSGPVCGACGVFEPWEKELVPRPNGGRLF